MTLESLFGPLVVLGLALLSGYGAYMSLRGEQRAESRETERRFRDSENDRKDLRSRLEAIDKEAVKREDFQRFDDKVGSRFEKLEHTVNNGALKTAQIVKDGLQSAILELLPHLRGGER